MAERSTLSSRSREMRALTTLAAAGPCLATSQTATVQMLRLMTISGVERRDIGQVPAREHQAPSAPSRQHRTNRPSRQYYSGNGLRAKRKLRAKRGFRQES